MEDKIPYILMLLVGLFLIYLGVKKKEFTGIGTSLFFQIFRPEDTNAQNRATDVTGAFVAFMGVLLSIFSIGGLLS